MHLRSKRVSRNLRLNSTVFALNIAFGIRNFGHPNRSLWGAAVAACLCLCLASNGQAQDPIAVLEDSVSTIVEKSEAAVVSIARIKPAPEVFQQQIDPFGKAHRARASDEDFDLIPNEFGAGILISPAKSHERLILTNMHVVRGGPIYSRDFSPGKSQLKAKDGTELWIHFSDRRRCRAGIIAGDPRSDLAVLRVDWYDADIDPTDYPVMDWQSADAARKGQFVVLFGNPYAIARDGSASVSWGLVSNLTRQPISPKRNRRADNEEIAERSMLNRLGTLMQIDSRMNLGSSGGAVLNLKGQLVGITTSLAAIEGYEQSGGFAFPINSITRRIVQSLLEGREVEYGMIGVFPAFVSPEDFAKLHTGLKQQTAAEAFEVSRGSPADLAGIKQHDLIVAVEGVTVHSEVDLMRLVGLYAPGRTISMTIWNQKLSQIHVRLGKWPVRDEEGIIETNPRYTPWRGLSVDYSTARSFALDVVSSGTLPVLVTKVAANSPGQQARIQPGDCITRVNDIVVQSPAEFHAAIRTVRGPVQLTLLSLRDNSIRNESSGGSKPATRTVQIGE